MPSRTQVIGLAAALLVAAQPIDATVYYSKQEALALAFGKGAEVETLALFLTPEQVRAAEKLARAKLDSKLYTFFVGKRGGVLIGYATIETHTVRTQPETLLVVLTPEGKLARVHVLAFHEPPEYQAADRWLARLAELPIDELEANKGIDGITGATLTTGAALAGVRKVLAVYRVGIAKEGP
ncbi:MAG: FMN-binding protein [Gammaproteobacteria bacterium]